jgi:hypothetical protein
MGWGLFLAVKGVIRSLAFPKYPAQTKKKSHQLFFLSFTVFGEI